MEPEVGKFYKRRGGGVVYVWRTGATNPDVSPEYGCFYILIDGQEPPEDRGVDQWFCRYDGLHYNPEHIRYESPGRNCGKLKPNTYANGTSDWDLVREVEPPPCTSELRIAQIQSWLNYQHDSSNPELRLNVLEVAMVCKGLRKVGLDIEVCSVNNMGDEVHEHFKVVRKVRSNSGV